MHRPPTKQAQEETPFHIKITQSQEVYKSPTTSATLQEEV